MIARRIAVGCGGLLLAALALAATVFVLQPTSFRIARSRSIAVAPGVLHTFLADANNLARVDIRFGPHEPGRVVRAAPGSPGPRTWLESSGPSGTSRLTLATATDELIAFESVSDGALGAAVRFELRPIATGTEVTLAVSNEMHGVARALWPFVNLEGRMAPHLESTLERLDAAVSAVPAASR